VMLMVHGPVQYSGMVQATANRVAASFELA
jgi:hypothetical protein